MLSQTRRSHQSGLSTATTPLRRDHREDRTEHRALPTGNNPPGGVSPDRWDGELRRGATGGAPPEERPSDLRHVQLPHRPRHPRYRVKTFDCDGGDAGIGGD